MKNLSDAEIQELVLEQQEQEREEEEEREALIQEEYLIKFGPEQYAKGLMLREDILKGGVLPAVDLPVNALSAGLMRVRGGYCVVFTASGGKVCLVKKSDFSSPYLFRSADSAIERITNSGWVGNILIK